MSHLDVILFVCIVIFLLFSRKIDDGEAFERDSTSALRGLAMLGIVLHHIHNYFGLGSPILSQVGYLTTGLFFFISGYGNMLSMNKKDNIEVKWFVSKFFKIYIPFFVAYWFYYICNVIFYSSEVPTKREMIQDIFTISLPNQVSWFPKIIVLCFLLHYIAKKVFHNGMIQLGAITMMLCIYIVIAYKKGMGWFWFNSVLCYPLGIWVSLIKDRFFEIINSRKKQCIFLICSIIIFTALFIGSRSFKTAQLFCALAFSIMCFAYTAIFKIKTQIMSWVGKNSFEFYLFHVACLQLFRKLISINHYYYTISVFVGTFFLVFIYLVIKRKIVK